MNKPYQSIALELYTKLPYKLDKNIWIKIMKEVKKKELLMNYFNSYKINNSDAVKFYLYCLDNSDNIFLHINKRSYYMYLLKKFFIKYNYYLKCRPKKPYRLIDEYGMMDTAIKTRDTGYMARKIEKREEDIHLNIINYKKSY
tara:strand:+ start:8116 stop:8544 length:429 start_codon:yes stop_codon:yes gene_type:complete